MAHTPGPWYAEGSDIVSAENVTVGVAIAGMTDEGYIAHAEVQANANLMAASPEMLAALRIAEDALDYAQAQVDSERDRKRLLHWRTQVQNAISLAEGTHGKERPLD